MSRLHRQYRAALKEPSQVVWTWVSKLHFVYLLQAGEHNFSTPYSHNLGRLFYSATLWVQLRNNPATNWKLAINTMGKIPFTELKPFQELTVQGWPKRWSPGSVNVRRKICVLLPAAGRKTQLFHLIFREPGVHLLGRPCTSRECKSSVMRRYSSFSEVYPGKR